LSRSVLVFATKTFIICSTESLYFESHKTVDESATVFCFTGKYSDDFGENLTTEHPPKKKIKTVKNGIFRLSMGLNFVNLL
jgi:hypothetical protein